MHNEHKHRARYAGVRTNAGAAGSPDAGGTNTGRGGLSGADTSDNTGPDSDTSADFADNLIPGVKAVLEQLARTPEMVSMVYIRGGRSGQSTEKVLGLCREYGVLHRFVKEEALNRMFAGNHQGVLARLSAVPRAELADLVEAASEAPLPLIVALDQVQDAGNAGALARTLYALGGAGLLLPKHNSVFLGAAAIKASAGALPLLPVARVPNLGRALETLQAQGFTVYATGSQGQSVFTANLRLPAVLVLGNEEKGVRPGVEKQTEETLCIPLARDFDSLNVAQAGAIFVAAFAGKALTTP